jgi:hypothetical protein
LNSTFFEASTKLYLAHEPLCFLEPESYRARISCGTSSLYQTMLYQDLGRKRRDTGGGGEGAGCPVCKKAAWTPTTAEV